MAELFKSVFFRGAEKDCKRVLSVAKIVIPCKSYQFWQAGACVPVPAYADSFCWGALSFGIRNRAFYLIPKLIGNCPRSRLITFLFIHAAHLFPTITHLPRKC